MPDTAAEAGLERKSAAAHRVGWGFIALVTLALKVNSLVGIEQAPSSLAVVTGIGALLSIVGNPFFGRMSDRTSWQLGMRRPWMVIGLVSGSLGILIVALTPSLPVVLVGWCIAQLFFNTQQAALVPVLPDQVPAAQRGLVAGVLGVCVPVASAVGTFLVQLFTGNLLAMFLAPCAIGGFFILLFAVTLKDRRLAKADRPTWSLREFASTFYVNPRKSPDFAWAFASRFMFVLAYAFPTTYQAYYLLDKIRSAEADVPRQIFLGTLAKSVVLVAASLIGGRLSDRTGRRKIFVLTASIVYGLAMLMVAFASDFNGFLVGMAIGGLGFDVYTAVDHALVVDVLPDNDNAARISVSSTSPPRFPSGSSSGNRDVRIRSNGDAVDQRWSACRRISRPDSSGTSPRVAACAQLRVGVSAGALVRVSRPRSDHPCRRQAPHPDTQGCSRRVHRSRDPGLVGHHDGDEWAGRAG